ncbi:hypothetical protein [Pseudomonas fulva]|uniref:hypothetical protein n=1 Tax=Pseudomonas fulva TaxID=47880 RepID=UPI0018A8E9CB|nr:hypothetical protein [Pseudomonas fulva]MBF8694939.1 hypothetical protein [Pseudomonas fulva]
MIDHLDHATFELTLSPRAMTTAERQRKLRKERKEAGIKPLHVTPAERELLSKALRFFGSVSRSPECAAGEVAALLDRVTPDAVNGQALAGCALSRVDEWDRLLREIEELKTARDRAIEDYWRGQESLTTLRNENAELKAGLQEIAADFTGRRVPTTPRPEVPALQEEIALLRSKLEKQHTENLFTIAEQGKAATAVDRLQKRLKAAGLPSDYRALPGES